MTNCSFKVVQDTSACEELSGISNGINMSAYSSGVNDKRMFSSRTAGARASTHAHGRPVSIHTYWLRQWGQASIRSRLCQNTRPQRADSCWWRRFSSINWKLGMWDGDVRLKMAKSSKRLWILMSSLQSAVPTTGYGNIVRLYFNVQYTLIYMIGLLTSDGWNCTSP